MSNDIEQEKYKPGESVVFKKLREKNRTENFTHDGTNSIFSGGGRIAVFDNLIEDEDFVRYIHEYYRDKYYWQYGNKGGFTPPIFFIGMDCIFNYTIYQCPIQQFLREKFLKHINAEIDTDGLNEIYLNGQTKGLDGGYHLDLPVTKVNLREPRYTLLYMVNAQNEDNVGDFDYRSGVVPFKGGRFVLFDGTISHRGMAPKDDDFRITLAWKAMKLKFFDTDV